MTSASERRTRVNLAVIAVSAAMFAMAWVGIVRADANRESLALMPAVADLAAGSADSGLIPAPGPATSSSQAELAPRRVVVVRQSRAS